MLARPLLGASSVRLLAASSVRSFAALSPSRGARLGAGASRAVLCAVAVVGGAVAAYRLLVTDAEAVSSRAARPIVVAGPSGVGKGTLIQKLLAEFPADFAFSVSHTTRAPRKGEVNGVHYWFVTRQEFETMLKAGAFIESNEYNGNLYGTSHAAVEHVAAQGRTCLFDVDINGVISLKAVTGFAQPPRYLFLSPPGDDPLAVLEQRLRGRGTESEESLRRRLTQAREELRYRDEPAFFDRVIVNDELDKAYAEFRAFCTQRDE